MITINTGISSDDAGRLLSLILLSISSSNRGSVRISVYSSTGGRREILSVSSSFGKTRGLVCIAGWRYRKLRA